MRKAKIICTIGPASNTRPVIHSLIRNGMDVARLNFSHGSHESHKKAVELIREGAERYRRPVAILQDLQGIKIRVGLIKNGSVMLKKGSHVLVSPGNGTGDQNRIYISYPHIVHDAKKGDGILLSDGLIHLEVLSKLKNALKTRVVEGGILKDKQGVNLPFKISTHSFTGKDKSDLGFGVKMGVDYVALSFVRTPDDVKRVRAWLNKRDAAIPLIAKIEKPEALSNIDGILEEAEGIMIARGDLGVEVAPEEVPVIQKRLIVLANKKGKVVITATQMLESMTNHMRPTRAEATDVANAVIDGSDALMLSGETATGKYPVEALKMMNRIITFTEQQTSTPLSAFKSEEITGFPEAIADAACRAAEDINARLIVAFTYSGYTARLISKFRPRTPVIAFTPREDVWRKASIFWGVIPKPIRSISNTDEMINEIARSLIKERLAYKGDSIVITASTPVLGSGETNLLRLLRI